MCPRPIFGTVYVLTHEVQPDGPRGLFGFQADVFDSAPGDADCSPLWSMKGIAAGTVFWFASAPWDPLARPEVRSR